MKKTPTPTANLDGIDFQEIVQVLLDKKWLIIACLALGGIAGAGYIARSPRIYASREVIQVEQQQPKVLNIQDVNPQEAQSSEEVKTIEQNLLSLTLFERVAKALKLPGDGSQLATTVTAKIRLGTRLIDVVAEDENPAQAQAIASTVVSEYMHQTAEARTGSAQNASEFLLDEAKRLKAKLEKSEQALQNYKEQTQAVSLEDRQNITVEKLKDLNQRVTEAKAEVLRLESDRADIDKYRGDYDRMSSIASIASNPQLIEYKKSIDAQEAVVAEVSQRYRAKHPKFIEANNQLVHLKAHLPAEVVSAAQGVIAAYEAAVTTEKKFEQALHDQEQAALSLNKIAIPYDTLVREVESDRALYDAVIKRMKETNVTRNLEQSSIQVVENAVLPKEPVRPDKLRVALLALAGGLAMGVALSFGLNAIDSSIKTVDKVEKILGLPVLGAVPRSNVEASLVFREVNSGVAEAFRSLRTSLSLLGKSELRKVTLFTSAVPGEGKSFCSITYAISLAQQGLRTLLIDADLRMPTIAPTLLQRDVNPGLTDLLTGQTTIDKAVHTVYENNLFILPSGSRTPNATELLGRSDFGALLAQAGKLFDRIVIDTAPINVVSDTLLLVEHAQSVCLVVNAGSTARKAALRAAAALTSAGHRPSGVILNRITTQGDAGYYYTYGASKIPATKPAAA
jgi:capsular exopolysaccharide synthesis family protein